MSPITLSTPITNASRAASRGASTTKNASLGLPSVFANARRAWAVRLNRVTRQPGSLWDGSLLDRLRTPPTRRWD